MKTLPQLSRKGEKLIELYEKMATEGYERTDGSSVSDAFSDFELRPYRDQLLPVIQKFNIRSILDYGCGGSDWNTPEFDESGKSAKEYFNLDQVCRYEPARQIDERQISDCVVSFDVLEHIFISDVPAVLRDMFSYANKLVIINVACYPAAAKLPNGENAHITVRGPLWWKGMIDCISVEFPDVTVWLLCSTEWRKTTGYEMWSEAERQSSNSFIINN